MLRAAGLSLAGAAGSPLLAACGSEPAGGRTGGSAATGGVAAAPVARSSVSRAIPGTDDHEAAVASVHAFSADLYHRVAAAPGNIVCSPYSVAVALAMTRNGARGRTAAEMDRVLHSSDLAALNAGLNAVERHLEALARTHRRADGSSATVSITTANSLWGQRDLTWSPAFLDELARHYGAAMRLVDYVGQREAARAAINDWTSDRTRGRIPEIIPPDVLDEDSRLTLVNAIYFKAPWEQPFVPALTRRAPFTRSDGSRVSVPMMSETFERAGYSRGDGWQAVDLPYAGSALAMAVLVPDRGRLPDVERRLDGPALHRLLRGFRQTAVQLDLPRWTFRTQTTMNEVLKELGMPTAFTDAADFSGMTTGVRLAIAAVLHEAFVAVDEEGTEAAAATAVVARQTSAAMGVLVRADRPFLFVIHDVKTATPLFVGRVADPSRAA